MVLDKLPTSSIITNEDNIYTIESEVYGDVFLCGAKAGR